MIIFFSKNSMFIISERLIDIHFLTSGEIHFPNSSKNSQQISYHSENNPWFVMNIALYKNTTVYNKKSIERKKKISA